MNDSINIEKQNAAAAPKTIHVTVPASVAYDLKKMQKVSAVVLGRLGCGGCHSGFDIRFLNESQFRFDEKINIIENQF